MRQGCSRRSGKDHPAGIENRETFNPRRSGEEEKMEIMNEKLIEKAAVNATEALLEAPGYWGSSNWEIAIDVDNGEAVIGHNTTCYGDRRVFVIPLYGFDTDGYFTFDEEGEEFTVIGNVDEFKSAMEPIMFESIERKLKEIEEEEE